MALNEIMTVTESPSLNLLNIIAPEKAARKIGLSPERIQKVMPELRQYVAFWREYPDLLVDFLQDGGNPEIKKSLNLYFYQRCFLRAAMRYKYVYATFPRAYSKSFLSILILVLKCILYPGAKLFVTSGGKEQAASIVKEKMGELCSLVPALEKELDKRPGKFREGKDYVRYSFKNGSYFDNVAASERSRGLRRHGGLIEECVGVDGKILSEVILPTMNVDRRCMDGTTQSSETLNKSQLYITTAGYKGTFSYDKLIQFLIWMVSEPEKSFVMGGTWRIPVLAGLQSADFINDMKKDGTFNEASFDREYESIWSGTSDGAYFDGEAFDRNRILNMPDKKYDNALKNGNSFYILSVDVGRNGCDTVVMVLKCLPQPQGFCIKNLVNIIAWDSMHFEQQAINLKKLYYQYQARRIVIDGNGIGIGLLDYMVKPQEIKETGDFYPDFGIYKIITGSGENQTDYVNNYTNFKTKDCEQNAIYVVKAQAPLNTDAHANLQVQLNSGKLKFLVDERVAKGKLMNTKLGQAMTPEERAEYLKPFVLTSILKDEMLNLCEINEGVNIILKQSNRMIKKDKVSSLEYGLYYIKHEEERGKKQKKFDASQWRFFSKG